MDALNGSIIKLRQTVLENTLDSREKTYFNIAHLNYLDGITVESLKSQLCPNGGDSQSNPYLRRSNIAVNLNIRDVVSAQCTELKYAKGYMLKLRGIEDPIIFTKCFDFYAADVSERYVWKPVCVSDDNVRATLGFETEIPLATPLAVECIRNMYFLVVNHHASIQWEDKLIYQLKKLYPFRIESVSWKTAEQTANQPGCWMVEIDKDACTIYKPWLLILLYAIANNGECLDTTDLMYDGILCIRAKADDTEILECAEVVKEAIDQHGERKISALLKNRIGERKISALLKNRIGDNDNTDNDNTFKQIQCLLSDDSFFTDD